MNTTVPSIYHAITSVTEKWKALIAAEEAKAVRTVAQRADALREEKAREVHVTGKTNYPRKG